jgi:hypothetical protein
MALSNTPAIGAAISSNTTLVGKSLDGKPKENLTIQKQSNNQEQPDFSSGEGQEPQKLSYSSPSEKVMIIDRIARANLVNEDKLKQISSMGPSSADMLASQLANQPSIQPSSSQSPSPSPQPSSQPRSSSSNQAVFKTIDSLKKSLKQQDQQIASLTEALSEKITFKDIKAPKFGSSRDRSEKASDAQSKSSETKVAETESKSNETQVAQAESNKEDTSLEVTFYESDDPIDNETQIA